MNTFFLKRAWPVLWLIAMMAGCVQHFEAQPIPEILKDPAVFGHIEVWQAEPSGRIFLPEVASFEFIRQEGGDRYRVDIGADSSFFIFSVGPGRYTLTRLILREGGFRANADVPLVFEVPSHGLGYLGKWSIQLESPNFTRELELKVKIEMAEALVDLTLQYPMFDMEKVVIRVAEPPVVRSRLYEMTPYPRFRWFNRHNPT